LVPDTIPLGIIQKVLKNLLREKIPIRNLVVILETIADYSIHSKDSEILTEYVRTALAETITDYLKQNDDTVVVATLDPRLEDHIMNTVKSGSGMLNNLGFSPEQVNKIFQDIGEKVEQMASVGATPTILVSPLIRSHLKRFVESVFPNIFVISFSELNMDTELKSVGTVSYPNESKKIHS
jgi:flagellar biosynthesis protein FlhA